MGERIKVRPIYDDGIIDSDWPAGKPIFTNSVPSNNDGNTTRPIEIINEQHGNMSVIIFKSGIDVEKERIPW